MAEGAYPDRDGRRRTTDQQHQQLYPHADELLGAEVAPADMLSNTKIAFVGSGSMAEAMIAGLVGQQLVEPGCVRASGPRAARGEALHQKYGIETTTANREAVEGA